MACGLWLVFGELGKAPSSDETLEMLPVNGRRSTSNKKFKRSQLLTYRFKYASLLQNAQPSNKGFSSIIDRLRCRANSKSVTSVLAGAVSMG